MFFNIFFIPEKWVSYNPVVLLCAVFTSEMAIN